ncbi:MAG: hypothetical protein NZ482_01835 [Gloeomargarita sp. SKYG98]|nr:hypothetical protein [Gloeomargarita sp. SKYG98]
MTTPCHFILIRLRDWQQPSSRELQTLLKLDDESALAQAQALFATLSPPLEMSLFWRGRWRLLAPHALQFPADTLKNALAYCQHHPDPYLDALAHWTATQHTAPAILHRHGNFYACYPQAQPQPIQMSQIAPFLDRKAYFQSLILADWPATL